MNFNQKIIVPVIISIAIGVQAQAQDTNTVDFYVGKKINLKEGIKISDLKGYLILPAEINMEHVDSIEIIYARGMRLVSREKYANPTNSIALKKTGVEGLKIKAGDRIIIALIGEANKIFGEGSESKGDVRGEERTFYLNVFLKSSGNEFTITIPIIE